MIEQIVKKTVEKYKLFTKEEKILVAVSGGKDSLAVADVLNRLGYDIHLLHIDLEISDFSEESKRVVEQFAKGRNLKLELIKVTDYGVRIEKVPPRPVCAVCGTVKRYLTNRYAVENGFDVLVTGHTMDDEIVFFLNNIRSGNFEYISKQKPIIPGSEKIVRKTKPLFFVSDEEIKEYVKENGVEIVKSVCPYSKGNTQTPVKTFVESLPAEYKRDLARNIAKLSEKFETKKEWRYCKICGYPTSSKDGICSFCKIKKYFERKEKV